MSDSPLIVPPKGRTVSRVTIEVDGNGRVELKAVNVTLGGDLPMHSLSLSALLVQVLASVVVQCHNDFLKGLPNAQAPPAPPSGATH